MPSSSLYINQIDLDQEFYVWASGQDVRRYNGSNWEYYNSANSAVPQVSPYYLDTRCISIDPEDKTKWVSVTTLLGALKQPFDSEAIALKCSQNQKKTNKWRGMSPAMIQYTWKKESERACNLGNWYHDQREQDIVGCNTIVRHEVELPVIKPLLDGTGKKLAPLQKLINGI
jgi:hypothetical protein